MVVEVQDLKGDAEVITLRNKRRHMFEFEFVLKWEVAFEDEGKCPTVGGTLAYKEVSALDDDYDNVTLTFDGGASGGGAVRGQDELKRMLGQQGEGLQASVAKQIGAFVAAFNEM